MNNNITFSIVPNKNHTKFKVAWTVQLGEYPTTKTLSKEFLSEEAAQQYLNRNREALTKTIREKISKIVVNIKEEVVEETVVEEEITEKNIEEVESEEVVTDEVVEEMLGTAIKENSEEKIIDYEEETPEEIIEEVITEEETSETEVSEEINEEDEEIVSKEIISVVEFPEETSETEGSEEINEEDEEIVSKEIISVVEFPEETPETEASEEINEELSLEEIDMVPRKTKKRKLGRKIIAWLLVVVLSFLAGYHAKQILKQDSNENNEEPGIESPEISEEPEEEVLNNEEFATLSATFIKILQDKNINVTTEDITKFVSIVNIDRLVEENPELANELFSTYTKEEYIQDSANIIGRTCQYNAKVFDKENSTTNFVRISDSLYGEQKQQLQIIESYVDRIAEVNNNPEQVNALVSELITRLSTGDLQNLDYGVQFAMQVSIEIIRSYIAKDVLTEENLIALTEITRLDVTEIMYMYDDVQGLNGTTKTLN